MAIHDFSMSGDKINHDDVIASNRSDVEQTFSPISVHNNESADIRLARQIADEMINVSGAKVKLFLRTDNADYDQVWDEDADPTYWNAIPIKGYFAPQPLESELTSWGVDTPNKTEIIFSHRQIYEHNQDRMIRTGDVVQIPYNSLMLKPKNYRVLNATPHGNYKYIWLYVLCQLEVLTADISVRVENDMQDNGIISEGTYRETI